MIKLRPGNSSLLLESGKPIKMTSTICRAVPNTVLWIETKKKLSRDECIDVMRDAHGVVAFDEMAGEATPTPLDVEEDEMVRVGRVREDPCNENCIMLWAVGNNLRKGAATNTVQIAEEMARRGLLAK